VADHRLAAVSRRPLITGVVAGAVLCGVWLMPSAEAGDDGTAAGDVEIAEPAERDGGE
jgi:hypothetical protein